MGNEGVYAQKGRLSILAHLAAAARLVDKGHAQHLERRQPRLLSLGVARVAAAQALGTHDDGLQRSVRSGRAVTVLPGWLKAAASAPVDRH